MEIWSYAIAAAAAVSLTSLVGAVGLLIREAFLKKIVTALVGLAVGVLLGDVFIHLLPESFARAHSPQWVSVLILAGMMLFFALEKAVRWQHRHVVSREDFDLNARSCAQICLIGDALHNFIDGVIIASSFLVSPMVGVATSVAVIAHEIPQEISDVGVLCYGGYSTRRAVWLNYLCSLTVIPGVVITLILSQSLGDGTVYLLPLAAGSFIYIAASDLIPQLQRQLPLRLELAQVATMAIGVATMAGVIALEQRLELSKEPIAPAPNYRPVAETVWQLPALAANPPPRW